MDFDTAVSLLMSPLVEGGYSNNPLDPGGETMWGVTKRVAVAHGYTGSMRLMPKEVAMTIYRSTYWDPQHIDDLPNQLRYAVFDACVNEGPAKAGEFLHECLNLEPGPIDSATTVAAGMADAWELVAGFLAHRVRHYTSLPTWGAFGRGWANRIATNLEILASLKGEA